MTDGACTLVAVGDIFLDRPDPDTAFAPVAEFLAGHDIVFGNLEAPISARGELPAWASKFPLKMSPEMTRGLSSAPFSVLSLANNHTMDYGVDAVLDTIEALSGAGIRSSGAGRNLADAETAAIVQYDGVQVGFISFQATDHERPDMSATGDRGGLNRLRISSYYPAPHVDPADLDRLAAAIGRVRATCDVVVVSCHWGLAGSISLTVPQLGIAEAAANAGADLVLGHHTHVPQAVSVIGQCPVIYGLGNFVFDWEFPHFVPRRLVAEFRLDGTGVREASVRFAIADPEIELVRLDDRRLGGAPDELVELSRRQGASLVADPDGHRLVISGA